MLKSDVFAILEVKEYCMRFVDDYTLLSGWIHDYYCDNDGSELIFDENNREYFECPICHYKYNDEKKKRAWVTKFRYKVFSQMESYSQKYSIGHNKEYLDFILTALDYYTTNYDKFPIHDKNGIVYKSNKPGINKCGKITAQGLNEAMIATQMANSVSNIKEYIPNEFKERIYKHLFMQIYELLKIQIDRVHNIQFYEICAIAMMGILANNKEMLDFAFGSEFSFYKQLDIGVTKDYFWYEGSFHYHLFILKPILEVLKLAKEYGYSIPLKYQDIVKNMLLMSYKCSFVDCSLPSPNDGWPNRGLEDYYEVFQIGNKVFNGDFNSILESIKSKRNDLSTIHCLDTGFSMIKNNFWNVFIKYKDNNINHAHYDKMNIEIKLGNSFLTRDLSTSGYGSKLTKEYYRKTYSHNTIVINGQDQNRECDSLVDFYQENEIAVTIKNIYDNVKATRSIVINENTFTDNIEVLISQDEIVDYIFHCEAKLITKLKTVLVGSLNEYPYFTDVEKIIPDNEKVTIEWLLDKKKIVSKINLDKKELYICKSPNNPNVNQRTTLIIRSNDFDKVKRFSVSWIIE